MSKNHPIIIGAGVSGLVAAIEMEKAGFTPLILEATESVGGRLKTDQESDLPIDHGFQVLLSDYSEAQKYLDFDSLDLIRFKPGSVIFKNGKQQKIGDPRRDISFLWSTLTSSIGSFSDKLRILKLSNKLKKKSIEDIFLTPEVSTLDYLRGLGFSNTIIESFFQPFFAGIFLEEKLGTSSRMFEFVYKMFGTGYATIPRNGIQEIPKQLAAQLNQSTFRFNTLVTQIENKTVHLENGEKLIADQIIIATDSNSILNKNNKSEVKWKSCYNIYLESESSVFNQPIIGLLSDKKLLVNNFHFLSDVFGGKKEILSVTVVKSHTFSESEMVQKVKNELEQYCNIKTKEVIKVFHIKKALPDLDQLKYEPVIKDLKINDVVYCCGDHLANGSLNAAMASGRLVAQQIIKLIKNYHK
jgi:protoporphyrinogen oxidase